MADINKVEINSYFISRIGALIKILEKLVELNKVKNHIENENSFNEFSKYIKSYEFCICFCLNQIIGILRDNQEFLDFKEDLLFVRAYNNSIPRSKFPTETECCIYANNIFGLINLLFKAKTYIELREAIPNVNKYVVIPFREIFHNYYEVTNEYKDLNKDDILIRLARSYFHLVFHDGDKIRIAYDDIVTKGRIYRQREQMIEDFLKGSKKKNHSSVEELDLEKGLTKIFDNANINRMKNIQEILNDQLFFEGYKLIIDYLWIELFEDPFSKYEFLKNITLCKDWAEFDNYFEKIRDKIIIPLENENEAIDSFFKRIFFKHRRIQNETLEILKKKILFSVNRENLTENEELDKNFLWYPVKLIDSMGSISCANQFILIFTGLMYFNKEIIRIIRFFHPQGNGYSYAIFIEGPTYSLLHDYASWYVFLDFATDHYGTAGSVKKTLDEYIHQFDSKVHLSEYKVNLEAFKDYIKVKEIKDLSNKIRKLEDYKADAKGIIFELVNTYIFSKLGYQVHWSLKENFTNYTEIDLLAFKKFRNMIRFYVIEITTTAQNLIEDVKKKIEILKTNSSYLLKFLDLEEHLNSKFRGIVISNTKTNLRVDKMVKLINFKDIINNLKDIKIDKRRLLKILEI